MLNPPQQIFCGLRQRAKTVFHDNILTHILQLENGLFSDLRKIFPCDAIFFAFCGILEIEVSERMVFA